MFILTEAPLKDLEWDDGCGGTVPLSPAALAIGGVCAPPAASRSASVAMNNRFLQNSANLNKRCASSSHGHRRNRRRSQRRFSVQHCNLRIDETVERPRRCPPDKPNLLSEALSVLIGCWLIRAALGRRTSSQGSQACINSRGRS